MVSAGQAPIGPHAPAMAIVYDGTAMYFTLSNPPGSNNENGMYAEAFEPTEPTPDPFWRFQGYVVYQLSPADADDNPTLVVRDLERVSMIGYTDIVDDVLSAWNNFILGADSCFSGEWIFDNDGPIMMMGSSISSLTGLAWHPDSIYCFLAMAFATTPHFMDPDCGTPQTMLFSKQGPFGPLQVQCVTPATVGMAEQMGARMRIWPNPVADVLHVRTPTPSSWRATCTDAQGRTVLQQRIFTEDVIPVSGLAGGVYHLMLRADDGSTISERFVVERAKR